MSGQVRIEKKILNYTLCLIIKTNETVNDQFHFFKTKNCLLC
jgi:hypothetical protein